MSLQPALAATFLARRRIDPATRDRLGDRRKSGAVASFAINLFFRFLSTHFQGPY
jgi:hypothetical protein